MVKYLNTSDTVENYIEFLKKKKSTFTWKFTNYTHTIEVNGKKEFFYDGANDNFKMFVAQKKIEKDIREAEKKGLYFDELEPSRIMYNQFNPHLLTPRVYFGEVWNIDLKCAYLQALFNVGAITLETYNYVLSAPKPIRLKAVGMLATTKNTFEYVNGEFIKYSSTTKDLRKYFFLASFIVGELLMKLKNLCTKEDFIFFWVDGIYILKRNDHNETREKMKKIIEGENFKFTEELLTEFRTTDTSIIYLKGETEKIFPLPKDDKNTVKEFIKKEIKQIIIK
jgi:hypothetical protein